MKKLLLSSAVFVSMTAAALAADLPARVAPPPPLPAVPVFTWTGFYVGVNGGVAFGDGNDHRRGGHHHHHVRVPGDGIRDTVRNNRRGNRDSGDDTSIMGGGQVGYNMQFGMFVAGLEADVQAIDFQRLNNGGHRHHVPNFPNGRNGTGGPPRPDNDGNNRRGDNGDDVDVFGTVRGRLGVTAFERSLLYVTGGLAWKSEQDPICGNGRGCSGSDDIGYTVGGGVEYAFTNNISLKIEGLYVDFSDGDNDRDRRNGRRRDLDGDRGGFNFSGNSREFGLVRAGINWRFNTF